MKNLRIWYILLLAVSLQSCAQDKNKSEAAQDKNVKHVKLNRLANASSPYLQEHADNPVDWYEWGPEALEKAKKENKPLIISIGYAACHWCHVMERETYMDSSVAKIMNENFVAIKIDREERPDIDQVYMNAAQLINGSGGWPLNAFALPNGKPFYAGTYYTTAQWKDILGQISKTYKKNPEKIISAANSLTEGIKQQDIINTPLEKETSFTKDDYTNLWENWKSIVDTKKGGFKRAPKFPLPVGWEFLLQYSALTGNEKAMEAVTTTLTQIARGGIYDQLGGGFSRYSVDENWFVPHFEKMLYDNAQLVSLYSKAYKITKDLEYAEVVKETLEFVNRELSNGKGGFYSSINADSEGEEGKYYVWKKEEIEKYLKPEEAEIFEKFYNVKERGNWEGQENILSREYTKEAFAREKGYDKNEFLKVLESAEQKMLKVRNQRVRPSTDDKVLTAWNALMIKAYLDAYTAFGDESYMARAREGLSFLEKNMQRHEEGLYRNYKDGKASINAFLDDYAFLASAYIKMYELTFEKKWLVKSKDITDYVLRNFLNNKSGMFYYTTADNEELIARKMELSDNVIPASNSEMAMVLYKLGNYFQDEAYLEQSKRMLSQVKDNVLQGGPYYANWARLMGMMVYSPFEIAIMGDQAVKLNLELQKNYIPVSLFMGGDEENLPLLESKLVKGDTYIYVCRNRTCKLPVKEPAKAMEQIQSTIQSDEKGFFWQ
ncbi:thioredoxin domain-containing protein [Christiangramia fulva]|uniref:Thioredoxin domain-containing protein n=1 Tax=Christiangramia fulva TaxID=2126553 RepID=A0A2R3Z483_9FLAO|nr:thioredoxin domain-containing protein [Christiangramia fulva]AVR45069.1 thioredoxin domain-containing protein [Christiangramia fulva]